MSSIVIANHTFTRSAGRDYKTSVSDFIQKLKSAKSYSNDEIDYAFVNTNVANLNNKNKTNIIFGPYDRITTEVELDNSENDGRECEFYDSVASKLYLHDYKIVSYIDGTCRQIGESRIFKIGKVLARFKADAKLINGFANSKERQATKKKMSVTISRNIYDLLSMSTFRGWRSCMAADGGNFHYVGADISCGTLIAYAHLDSDKNIDNPSGRVLLKPVIVPINDYSDYIIMYVRERSSYGTISKEVDRAITAITNGINKKISEQYNLGEVVEGKIPTSIYKDSVSGSQVFFLFEDGIDLNTYDFSKFSGDTIRSIIRSKFEDTWKAAANPTLIEYICHSDLSNVISREDNDKSRELLGLLNQNPNIDVVQEKIRRIYTYLDYSSEKRHLSRILSEFDSLVKNLSTECIDYIQSDYLVPELKKALEKDNKNYILYSLSECYDEDYKPSGILKGMDITNIPHATTGSNLQKEINFLLEIDPSYKNIYGTRRTTLKWDNILKNLTPRDKLYALNFMANSISFSDALFTSTIEDINSALGTTYSLDDLYTASGRYVESYRLINNNQEFNLPVMIKDTMHMFS